MKRKIIIAVLALALIAVLAPSAFAALNQNQAGDPAFFKQMFEWRKSQVDQAVKDGQLTPEQGQVWKEHFDYMQKFHEENGYTCPRGRMMGGSGPCGMMGGRGPGGRGNGFGAGMMGNWGAPGNNANGS